MKDEFWKMLEQAAKEGRVEFHETKPVFKVKDAPVTYVMVVHPRGTLIEGEVISRKPDRRK